MILLFAKYGWKELLFFSLLWSAIAAALWFAPPVARYALPVPVVGLLFTLNFFRDPPRRIPSEPGLMVSPADGVVVEIADMVEPEFLNVPCTRIAIFLNVFNVHINRSPCDGVVRALKYKPGKFLDVRHPDCSTLNESNTIHLGGVVVKQIAGLIARRIVCEAKPQDTLTRGEKFGMIKFGSRTELYIPKDQVQEIRVKLKDKVKGGETIIARTR
ncbi:MAG TPA: phosphatidylserine decarboxylase family protein [Planctomycetota bacterium]|nr:phosphatidylserine decarboxylase family protein [Planctomycetota bacterium]